MTAADIAAALGMPQRVAAKERMRRAGHPRVGSVELLRLRRQRLIKRGVGPAADLPKD